jgi:excisionase family DNA binding protein
VVSILLTLKVTLTLLLHKLQNLYSASMTTKPDSMERLLLRPTEVSELVGIGKSKVYELLAAGVIPSVRIGKSVRVPADRLRQWIEELQAGEPPKTHQKSA